MIVGKCQTPEVSKWGHLTSNARKIRQEKELPAFASSDSAEPPFVVEMFFLDKANTMKTVFPPWPNLLFGVIEPISL